MTSAIAERPYMRLRCVTGTLPGRNPLIRTRSFNSSRRASTLASSSEAGTTTLYSRLRPSESVSVTCIWPHFSLLALASHRHQALRAGRVGIRAETTRELIQPFILVRAEGLEPPRLSPLEPKSSASTSSATPAKGDHRKHPAPSPAAGKYPVCRRRGLYHASSGAQQKNGPRTGLVQ